MHAQQFHRGWPAVVDEMREFIVLTHLGFAADRPSVVRLRLARPLVSAAQLQPHVGRLREDLARQLPQARLDIAAVQAPAHRVEVEFAGERR